MKIEHEGQEIEVYTAAELQERETAARTAVEGEYKPKLTKAEEEREEARKALAERTGEFKQFRKLNEDQLAKLSVAERTIYENQLAMAEKDAKLAEADKKAYESSVDSAIRAKIGNDANLFTKVKEMYGLINIEDVTPEGIATRVAAALGALGQTAPDLLASAGLGVGGTYEPPKPRGEGEKTFADSDTGKAIANELGLMVEPPEKK